MFFVNEKDNMVNLDHVYFIKKEFLMKDKKYVILLQFNTGVGYMAWKYETEEARNKEYETLRKAMGTLK